MGNTNLSPIRPFSGSNVSGTSQSGTAGLKVFDDLAIKLSQTKDLPSAENVAKGILKKADSPAKIKKATDSLGEMVRKNWQVNSTKDSMLLETVVLFGQLYDRANAGLKTGEINKPADKEALLKTKAGAIYMLKEIAGSPVDEKSPDVKKGHPIFVVKQDAYNLLNRLKISGYTNPLD